MSDWRADLDDIISSPARQIEPTQHQSLREIDDEGFLAEVVLPAFKDLRVELERHGRTVTIDDQPLYKSVSLAVEFGKEPELEYLIKAEASGGVGRVKADILYPTDRGSETADGALTEEARGKSFSEITREDIIGSFLRDYRKYRAQS